MSVEVKDKGLDKVLKELRELNSYVKVGVLSSNTDKVNGVPVVEYATYNENGVAGKNGWKIPPRPFLKSWVANKKKEISAIFHSTLMKVVEKKLSARKALDTIGVFGKSGVQECIRTGDFVPNSPKTIAMKGSSQPLIDTGTLRKSINYEVEK